MNKARIWRNARTCRVGLAMFLWAATLVGCSTVTPPLAVQSKLPCQGSGWQVWKEGVAALQKKNYNKAAAFFQSLAQHAQDESIRRNALYALACTRLVMADSNASAKAAMALWDEWGKSSSKPLRHADPRLLTPFLKRITAEGMCNWDNKAEKDLEANETQACSKLLQAKDKDLQRTKVRLEAKEKEAATLRNQILNLRHQIDSLEMIHREIQEKKREVTSP